MGASIDALDPELRSALQELSQWLGSQRVILTVTSTVRSARDQDFLWRRAKAGLSGGLPAAPPGHSAHEYGWAFDAIVSPVEYQEPVGKAWERLWGGKWGGSRDPVHFELPGASQLAWKLGEEGAQTTGRTPPPEGGAFYELADFLSSFVPGLGQVQLVDLLVSALDGNNDIATFYLHHPAEALRDLGTFVASQV
jgi:hypothetical protein